MSVLGIFRYASSTLLGLVVLLSVLPASAQPYEVPPTWGGDFWSRPRLTGSWFGLRDELGKKGAVFDVDLRLTPQSVMTGGVDTGGEFWGNAEYTLNVDRRQARALAGRLSESDGGAACGATRIDSSSTRTRPTSPTCS